MSLTSDEEAKVRIIISAFDGGQQVDDLPLATSSIQDKELEVFDKKTGASGRMSVRDAVNMANAPYFARIFDNNSGSPVAVGWEGSLDFGRRIAEELELGGYLVKNDHSRRKLDPTNHYRFATGEAAKLDGSMGHYQWGPGKKCYIALWESGGLFYEALSLAPIPGKYNYCIPVCSMSAAGHAAMERSTNTLVSYINEDVDYRGGDNQSSYDGTYRTLLGRAVTSITTEAARAAARRNGVGWMAGTMRHAFMVAVLFEIIFGNRDMQAAYNPERDKDGLYQGGLGAGVTGFSAWNNYNGYRPFLPMDVGVELGDACGIVNHEVKDADGNVVYTAPVPVFFGLKNPHGYLWHLQDDEFCQVNEDTSMTHLVAPSIYGTWTCGVATGMVAKSKSPTQGEGYIKKISYENFELFPTQIGATSATHYCDYFWNTSGVTSGFRLVLRGCNAVSGGQSGPFDVSVSGAVTVSVVDIGSPLCEAAEEWPLDPVYAEVA